MENLNRLTPFVLILCFLTLGSSTFKKWQHKIVVENPTNLVRTETIEIGLGSLKPALAKMSASLVVKDQQTGKVLVTQLLDADEKAKKIIFQTELEPNEKKSFLLYASNEDKPTVTKTTFGRFVPERIDDFAWENGYSSNWTNLRTWPNDYRKSFLNSTARAYFNFEHEESMWQLISAWESMKKQPILDYDGFSWCSLHGGPNSATYQKPLFSIGATK